MASEALAFPGYRTLRRLGKGGMGEVFLAEDEALGRRVAIKTLTSTEEGRARFLREARSLATLDHPRVVRIHSYGETADSPFFVMEYVEGETLADRLSRGPMPIAEAVRIARQIVEALAAAQRRGLIHRDVKPSNVLLDGEGQVRVADFGLARSVSLSDGLTGTGEFAGSPHYMAPEQARAELVDFRADMYALGIVLFEMLTGRKPFPTGSAAVLIAQHLMTPIPPVTEDRPETPAWLASLVASLTQKDPGLRPSSYESILSALANETTLQSPLGTGTLTGTLTSAPSTGGVRQARRHAWAAALAVIALGLLGWWLAHRRPSGSVIVVVAPFSAEDPESSAEGRTLATLIQDEVEHVAKGRSVIVVGPEDIQRAPGTESGAARLLAREEAAMIVWGRILKLDHRTEIEPRITLASEAHAPQGWPDITSVDDGAEGLAARRRLAQSIASGIRSAIR